MLWTKVGFRGCDDGRAFNTRITVGYTVPRWSIQFIIRHVGVSFIHSHILAPSCEGKAVD